MNENDTVNAHIIVCYKTPNQALGKYDTCISTPCEILIRLSEKRLRRNLHPVRYLIRLSGHQVTKPYVE